MDYCMRAYGVKNSDRQIKSSPIPTESQFAKFSRYTVCICHGPNLEQH